MNVRAGTLFLCCSWVAFSMGGCGHNVDQPIPEAGPGGHDGQDGQKDAGALTDGDPPEPDADEGEEAAPPPPSACPVPPPIRITQAPAHSGQPGLLWTGSGYLVVWADERNGGSDIYATKLTPEGGRLTGYPDLLVADTAERATSPEIVPLADPAQGYLVVFENCEGPDRANCTMGSVQSVRLTADGLLPVEEAPVIVSPRAAEQRRPYLATGHGNVYVTYRDRIAAAGTTAARTVARLGRLNATGAPIPPLLTFDQTGDGHYPHVAVSPNRVALIYQRHQPDPQIVLALLDQDLAVQGELIVRSGFAGDATNPVVQWNGQGWVLAWEDERLGEAAIYATTAAANGSTFEAPQRAYEENGNWPTIASGGMMTSLIGFYGYPGRRIFLARLEATGRLKPGQVVIDDSGSAFPAVAYNDRDGQYAVVYQNERLDEVMFVRFTCTD
jgi:hypothetical protein